MPTSLTIPLSENERAALPPYPGRACHALFYQWLALGDYNLANEVHDDEGLRPFTVSPVGRNGNGARLRFNVLDDTLWPALERGMARTPVVELLGRPLQMPLQGPEIRQRFYADLVEQARTDTTLRLRFLSPTSFRSREMHFPLPDPLLVYQSWLNRWNAFAPTEFQINVALLDIVAAHIAIGRYELATEMVDLGRERKAIGFVGQVQYTILRPQLLDAGLLRQLNCLADYAVFCGTGHKTAQGMGVTERV